MAVLFGLQNIFFKILVTSVAEYGPYLKSWFRQIICSTKNWLSRVNIMNPNIFSANSSFWKLIRKLDADVIPHIFRLVDKGSAGRCDKIGFLPSAAPLPRPLQESASHFGYFHVVENVKGRFKRLPLIQNQLLDLTFTKWDLQCSTWVLATDGNSQISRSILFQCRKGKPLITHLYL